MTRELVENENCKHWALCFIASAASLIAAGIAIQQGFRAGNDAMLLAVMMKLGKDEL